MFSSRQLNSLEEPESASGDDTTRQVILCDQLLRDNIHLSTTLCRALLVHVDSTSHQPPHRRLQPGNITNFKMHGITDQILHAVLQHWASALLIIVAAWLIRNRYHNGLNKYPGPFLASLTDWWRFVDVLNRRPELTHLKLHEKHGDVVRLGPNTLSFADPAALKAIYGLNKGYVKVSTHWIREAGTPGDEKLTMLFEISTVRFLCGATSRCQRPVATESVQYRRQ